MGAPLEIAGAHKRTEKGNNDWYYGGGDLAWPNMATALSGVGVSIRPGKTIGVIENSKVVEYIWPAIGDVSGNPTKKTTDVDLTDANNRIKNLEDNKANTTDVTAGDSAVINQLTGTAPVNANTLGKLYSMLQGIQGLINGDDINLDSIKELADAIKAEQSTIDALTGNKLNKTDVYNALDYAIAGKALDARQGKVLADLTSANATAIANLLTSVNNNTSAIAAEVLARQNADSTKRDKLEGFYTTQTASFNMAADMVDKTIRCSHATIGITATIADDNLFAIGARFEVRQSGVASVTLAAANGITLNAPQGVILTRRYSSMLVIKQAAGIYSVTIIGDDSTKVDKVAGRDLSDYNYSAAERAKLGSIVAGFNVIFTAPKRDLGKIYLDKALTIYGIILDGANAFSYSINGGTSYITPTLPLAANIVLPAGWVKFRITFTSNVTDATAFLKLEQ